MESSNDLVVLLFIWVAATLAVVVVSTVRKGESVGLSFGYVLTLTIIHFFGALLYALPWHQSMLYPTVEAGFRQSVYGVVAFVIGNVAVAPALMKALDPAWLSGATHRPEWKLPERYVVLGFLFFSVLAPALRGIPSIAAASVTGVYLSLAGIALGTWRAWHTGRRWEFRGWLIVAAGIPFVTMLALGFLGYGAIALMVILLFVFQFYRPRLRGLLIGILVLYLGLSFFVNYARERSDLRDAVWGGAEISSRIERLVPMFTEFEFIDLKNPEHTFWINERLNQNVLVGAAVMNLEHGGVGFAQGETIWLAVIGVIPRALWPNKPKVGGGGDIVTRFTGIEFAEGTSVGVGQVLEFYLNFGTIGVIVGFLIFGIVVRAVDTAAARRLTQGDWEGFVMWFLPGLGLLQTGGNLVEITSTVAASIVLCVFVNNYVLPAWRGRVAKVSVK